MPVIVTEAQELEPLPEMARALQAGMNMAGMAAMGGRPGATHDRESGTQPKLR
jgi:hypothetical protein